MSLRILLTNDDGWEAPGIRALQTALREASHSVVVVAPAGNQSGASARISPSGSLTVEQPDGHNDVWAVAGSPADAVIFGLSHAMADAAPDLVVSGANAGANAGQAVHFSGTVGAAVCATSFGVPAVAVSTDMAWDHKPQGADFDRTARLVVALLEWGAPSDLVPAGVVLNVNVPSAEHEDPVFFAATVADQLPMGRMRYAAGATESEFKLTFEKGPTPADGTDVAAVRGGAVSLSAVAVTGLLDDEVPSHLARVAADLSARRLGT